MIKPKEPKDMTAPEFVEYMKKRVTEKLATRELSNVGAYTPHAFYCEAERLLSEDAPDLFTPDQIATMRQYQRDGANYVVNNNGTVLLFFKDKPRISRSNCRWESDSGRMCTVCNDWSFLGKVLERDEIMCFADYAPLEEK